MKIFNTLSRHVQEFEPLKPPQVKLYACGPTVYDYAHLGHLRKYTMDDILVRTLRLNNYQVTHVQNVTDVGHLASDADTGEDKIEKGAKKYNLDPYALAKKFEDYFYYSMDLMGNLRPTITCRATEHIQEMMDIVEALEEKGYTYIIENDGVYFDTSKWQEYGELSGINVDELMEGARVEKVPGKKQPTDFALWKFERPGENRVMVWKSKWHERSYPGWHIECSAMSMKYLGEQIDIHTGGIDHIPTHHTNEIVQSEAVTGKRPFSKYWVHHNFLQIEGEKMSKSLDNFFTIDDVIKKGLSPIALRLLFLSTHYRSEMNFTWQNLAGSQKSWDRLLQLVEELRQDKEKLPGMSAQAQSFQQQFFEAVNDDLDTPGALAIFWQVVKDEVLPQSEKLQLLLSFDEIFGLGLASAKAVKTKIDVESLPAKARNLLQQRTEARNNKNFQLADQLREQLREMGYKVEDLAEGENIITRD